MDYEVRCWGADVLIGRNSCVFECKIRGRDFPTSFQDSEASLEILSLLFLSHEILVLISSSSYSHQLCTWWQGTGSIFNWPLRSQGNGQKSVDWSRFAVVGGQLVEWLWIPTIKLSSSDSGKEPLPAVLSHQSSKCFRDALRLGYPGGEPQAMLNTAVLPHN